MADADDDHPADDAGRRLGLGDPVGEAADIVVVGDADVGGDVRRDEDLAVDRAFGGDARCSSRGRDRGSRRASGTPTTPGRRRRGSWRSRASDSRRGRRRGRRGRCRGARPAGGPAPARRPPRCGSGVRPSARRRHRKLVPCGPGARPRCAATVSPMSAKRRAAERARRRSPARRRGSARARGYGRCPARSGRCRGRR